VLLLTSFIAAGSAALVLHPQIRVTPTEAPAQAADWFAAALLMVYAYGGFEAALFASGEANNPRKDAPVALAIALVTATLLYVAVQYDAGESCVDDEARRGRGAAVYGPCRSVACGGGHFGLGVRILEREHAAYSTSNVCDGRARGLSGFFRGDTSSVSNATYFDRGIRSVADCVFGSWGLSVECNFVGCSASVHVRSGGGGLAGFAAKEARGSGFSVARRNGVCRSGAGFHGLAAYDRTLERRCGRAGHVYDCGGVLVLGAPTDRTSSDD
jgi:hypothetical protein